MKDLQQGYTRLEERVHVLSSPASPQGAAAAAPSVVMIPPSPGYPSPTGFLGEHSQFRTFRNACELYLALQPRTFSLEVTKVGFLISLLSGEPETWAHRLLEQKAESLNHLTTFFAAMYQLYEDPQQTATAESALYALQQGRRAAEDMWHSSGSGFPTLIETMLPGVINSG